MRLNDSFRAATQLGWDQAFFNIAYRLGVRFGWYKSINKLKLPPYYLPDLNLFDPIDPDAFRNLIKEKELNSLISKADLITQGKFEPFGNGASPINLNPTGIDFHWCDLERDPSQLPEDIDIKEIWEPARFAWAVILARAYHLTGNEKYLDSFLNYGQRFITLNPVDQGPNWLSGQEVGIRLINVLLASVLFRHSLLSEDVEWIASLIVTHADRIYKTLAYSRSQNNNHYLIESVALLSAAKALPELKMAKKWYKTGIKGIIWCLNKQFHSDGEYVQHSTNYHRLVLQALLWAAILEPKIKTLPQAEIIKKATIWYKERIDLQSGKVPNLGANDGALIFELDQCGFFDHRGVLQQALGFFGGEMLRSGIWDEGLAWFGVQPATIDTLVDRDPTILRNQKSWGMLRVIRHKNRPSHADHLHFDLWWKGLNICLDPGTYSYNLPAPWTNELTSAIYHNTVTINGSDQMRKVSKFLYLDWNDSWLKDSTSDHILAATNSWLSYEVNLIREIKIINSVEWNIIDTITKQTPHEEDFSEIHWNFPNYPWTLIEADGGYELSIRSQVGKFSVVVSSSHPIIGIKLVSAGEVLHGNLQARPTEGWVSRTYLHKEPCLGLTFRIPLAPEIQFITHIRLDEI